MSRLVGNSAGIYNRYLPYSILQISFLKKGLLKHVSTFSPFWQSPD